MKKILFIIILIILIVAGLIVIDRKEKTVNSKESKNTLSLKNEIADKNEITNEIDNISNSENEIVDNIVDEISDDENIQENNPVSQHGKLSVNGTNIVDKNGNIFQLKGISTHGLQWFPQYVNQEAFDYMRDEWKINTVRLAMYSAPNDGYTTDLHKLVSDGVEYAKNSGLYVIIDWHILSDGNPNINKASAINFFKEMSTKYKDYENVIYEICNEPNGDVQWERDVKPYAQEVITEIRKIDDDAIIIVGTPTWSQDVDVVAQSPITGFENIMYTLHLPMLHYLVIYLMFL